MRISKHAIQRIKESYPSGTKVTILTVNDPYINLPVGIKGKVLYVDDKGRIHVTLDNGRVISLDFNKDKITKEK